MERQGLELAAACGQSLRLDCGLGLLDQRPPARPMTTRQRTDGGNEQGIDIGHMRDFPRVTAFDFHEFRVVLLQKLGNPLVAICARAPFQTQSWLSVQANMFGCSGILFTFARLVFVLWRGSDPNRWTFLLQRRTVSNVALCLGEVVYHFSVQ